VESVQATNLIVISWNINNGLETKWGDVSFRNYLCTYDVVFLCECWISNDFQFEVDGFETHVFPRLKSKTKQGGGMVILIKNEFTPLISISELCYDTIVWLKIDKQITTCDDDLFVSFVYMSPASSTYFKKYDVDLYYELETQVAAYSTRGKVMVMGDLNSRTRTANDFITNDSLHHSVSERLGCIFAYDNDVCLPPRINPDKGHNEYGTRLINLCKATGLRILNGRHKDGFANDFTFNGAQGLSMIDYLLTTIDMFDHVQRFIVCNFNTFSDHAPLHMNLLCTPPSRDMANDDPHTTGTRRETFRWKSEHLHECREAVRTNLDALAVNFDSGDITSLIEMDTRVDAFVSELGQIMSPFCKTHHLPSRRTNDSNSNCKVNTHMLQPTDRIDDKPWFNDELKSKYIEYIHSLKSFNRDKSSENHILLHSKKQCYKTLEIKRKRSYLRSEGNMIVQLKKNNPKQFYAKFSRRKKRRIDFTLKDGFDHFKSLSESCSADGFQGSDATASNDVVFEELDTEISIDEIQKSISLLKRNKSHGSDGMLNEFFIECTDFLLPILHKMFNCILMTGIFPSSWSSAVIIPIFKKGDRSDPNNYRGISLVSSLGKLFTSVINHRLLNWSATNDVMTDAQFGFQPGFSTVDAIFALHALVTKSLTAKKRLYCAFIDFRKAFDSIDRVKLWLKLSKLGIRGKVLNIIKSMYENVKSSVCIDGFQSDYFVNRLGLMQGEVLSPILFSMYVNDFEMSFVQNDCIPYECQSLNLFVLMYADDLVLFSESVQGLQSQLDALLAYSRRWGLSVNVDKSKILIFRNGGKLHDSELFMYGEECLEIVDSFNYLGMLFNFNNKFRVAESHIADQGRKAMFALKRNSKSLSLNVETMLSLFDCYIGSVLNYGAEIWGFHKGTNIERVHLDYCKTLLGVKKTTCNVMVYTELGRYPLRYIRIYRMIKYWCKLLNTNNCILRACYDTLYADAQRNVKNWAYNIKTELTDLGFSDVWNSQSLEYVSLPVIKQRIFDHAVQCLQGIIDSSPKCRLYRYLYDSYTLQHYLRKSVLYAKHITRIRLSAHNLSIETGRYHKNTDTTRYCFLCKNVTEDEYHFILKCPLYNDLRQQYIKTYYWKKPSTFKLVQLLCTQNLKQLRHLGVYIFKAVKLRTITV
jgi:exonuclease III